MSKSEHEISSRLLTVLGVPYQLVLSKRCLCVATQQISRIIHLLICVDGSWNFSGGGWSILNTLVLFLIMCKRKLWKTSVTLPRFGRVWRGFFLDAKKGRHHRTSGQICPKLCAYFALKRLHELIMTVSSFCLMLSFESQESITYVILDCLNIP